ncbi:MAG: radical SAM protein [Desulfobacterales bacterium]|nr:radical SAM protein [Desulfobacterales bacterium]
MSVPCTFCAGFRITGRRIRHRPLSRVWDEIELLVSRFGVREVHIEDDNFTFDADYAKQFCREALVRKLPVCFSTPNGVRLDTLDDELLDLMKRAGWYVVHCGIESGSDRVLRSVRKALSTSVTADRIAMIKRHGLPVAVLHHGLPGETRKTLKRPSPSVSSGLDWGPVRELPSDTGLRGR